MDVLTTLFSQLVKTLWESGPMGMLAASTIVGWGTAIYMYVKNRGKPKKTEPTTIDYVSDIKKLHDKYLASINELNEKYNATVLDLNEKRIMDMKDLNAGYNAIARDLLATLDKIANNIKISEEDL